MKEIIMLTDEGKLFLEKSIILVLLVFKDRYAERIPSATVL